MSQTARSPRIDVTERCDTRIGERLHCTLNARAARWPVPARWVNVLLALSLMAFLAGAAALFGLAAVSGHVPVPSSSADCWSDSINRPATGTFFAGDDRFLCVEAW